MKDRFNIIIPAFKTQDFIEDTVSSVEEQSFFKNNNNYRILIGIDGCYETLEKLQSIRHKYKNLDIYMMDSNKGLFITLNTLFTLVDSTNIIKFDSDDIMLPHLVSTVSQHINNYDIIRFASDNFVGTPDNIVKRAVVPHGSGFINLLFYKRMGGYRPWICGADTDFLWRAEGLSKELIIKIPLFLRRIHQNSLTQNPNTNRFSTIRMEYSKRLKKGFVYVEPILNNYKKI